MYLPKSFEESDRVVMQGFIQKHPLATLVTSSEAGLCADHMPLLLFTEGTRVILRGHVARANPAWVTIERRPEVLAIFLDTGRYISPSWYASKAQTGRVVPTWNYAAVHASGTARTQHDPAWLRTLLARLTDTFEVDRTLPWKLDDAPDDYIGAQLKAIVGIEISVTSMVGKWKMSQNRSPADIDGVVSGLQRVDDPAADAMALEVQRRRPG